MTIFSRNELYWGAEVQNNIKTKHVAIFGLGGVGGFCAEMLARSGVGELTIVDFDKVDKSNINRQIIALQSTLGQNKAVLFEQRLKDINPDIKINVINDFYTEIINDKIFSSKLDFIADAIDTMHSKISLIEYGYMNQIPIISSFGAGNRINPQDLYICDISEIENRNLPFISGLLYQLDKKNILDGITVVASREKPFVMEKIKTKSQFKTRTGREISFEKIVASSTPFVASTSGIFMASFIVKQLIQS